MNSSFQNCSVDSLWFSWYFDSAIFISLPIALNLTVPTASGPVSQFQVTAFLIWSVGCDVIHENVCLILQSYLRSTEQFGLCYNMEQHTIEICWPPQSMDVVYSLSHSIALWFLEFIQMNVKTGISQQPSGDVTTARDKSTNRYDDIPRHSQCECYARIIYTVILDY